MEALIIGQKQREQIAELRAVAAATVIDPAAAQQTANADKAAFRDMMAMHSIVLPVGYCVTYSHENQPFGSARHISISVDRSRKMPSLQAVEMILASFDMAPLMKSLSVWIENIDPTTKTINVLQSLEKTP